VIVLHWKQLLGISNWQKNTELKIAFEKLNFLATEMEKGNDKDSDLRFWKEEIAIIHSVDKGNSFLLTKAREGYEMLFRMFLSKHGLNKEKEMLENKV